MNKYARKTTRTLVKSMWLPTLVTLCGFLSNATSTKAQNTITIERSPEALAVIQRIVDASGGAESLNKIQDIVVTGSLSGPSDSDSTEATPLTISQKGSDELRVESALPTGKTYLLYSRDKVLRKGPDGSTVPQSGDDSSKIASHFFPLMSLAAALQDTSYSAILMGAVTDEISGHILNRLHIQRHKTGAKGSVQFTQSLMALDYYVDSSTALINRVQHLHLDRGRVPTNSDRNPTEIYSFDDYRMESALLLPHKIVTSVDKRLISTVRLSNYKLNSGLTENDFYVR